MVRAVPGRDRITRGHLPAGSAVARAVGEGPRGRSAGGEGVPREPGDAGGGGPRPPPSCSPRPCRAVRNPARTDPAPTHSGWACGRAPAVTLTPEGRPTAEPSSRGGVSYCT